MMNRIVLVGRLTRDPELRRTNSDSSVASFTLAVDDRMKDANGQKTTTFIGVTVWNQQADNVAKFCRKGSLVGVDGRIRQRTYERRDGTKASVIEVIADSITFLEPKSKEIPNEEVPLDEPVHDENKNLDTIDVTDDDLPF
ncbi:MAG TPA: single-stranded DNA-binding protein [Firmicutes bacterium]|nr:single-stranded DNA-binding protein [Bacillota bacterium]